MTVKYGKFELPTSIKIEEETKSSTYSKFIAEAFERGYGHTIGNALRRILLTSIESPAITSVKIEGISHEYMAVEGIIEDMTHIVLNFKGSLLRRLPLDEEKYSRDQKILSKTLDVTQEMLDENNGQYSVTFGDVVDDPNFEIVNPDHHLFTVTKPMTKRIDLKVAINRGYVSAERHDASQKVVDEILIDSSFSPVKLVNYYVENTRVGQDTDFDKLILEVTTDGRITPQEAIMFSTQLAVLHLEVFQSLKFHDISFDNEVQDSDSDRDELLSKLCLRINEIELSVRSTNCLAQANIDTIAELVIMPEPEMLKFRNFGKKSLNEIKAKLEDMHLHLGMDLSKYGINRDNVMQIVEEYMEQKLGQEG